MTEMLPQRMEGPSQIKQRPLSYTTIIATQLGSSSHFLWQKFPMLKWKDVSLKTLTWVFLLWVFSHSFALGQHYTNLQFGGWITDRQNVLTLGDCDTGERTRSHLMCKEKNISYVFFLTIPPLHGPRTSVMNLIRSNWQDICLFLKSS